MATPAEPDILIDTNVLVYAYDRSEPEKQRIALDTLDRLSQSGHGALSTQVLGEFYAVVTRKFNEPLSPSEARAHIENYLASWPVLPLTPFVIYEALRGATEHQMSYLDAQLWAVARLNQLRMIASEDFSNGAIVDGVQFLDPFTSELHVE